jgi:hypothetical protein
MPSETKDVQAAPAAVGINSSPRKAADVRDHVVSLYASW